MYYFGPESTLFVSTSAPTERDTKIIRSNLDVTGEFGPRATRWVDIGPPFRKRKPQEGEGGGICQRSGFWFPESALVNDGGRRVGIDFYHPKP